MKVLVALALLVPVPWFLRNAFVRARKNQPPVPRVLCLSDGTIAFQMPTIGFTRPDCAGYCTRNTFYMPGSQEAAHEACAAN